MPDAKGNPTPGDWDYKIASALYPKAAITAPVSMTPGDWKSRLMTPPVAKSPLMAPRLAPVVNPNLGVWQSRLLGPQAPVGGIPAGMFGDPGGTLTQGNVSSTIDPGALRTIQMPGSAGGAGGGMFAGMSGMDKAQLALGGIQTIGGLWAAFQSAKMANKQFNFTKRTTEANMANQIQSYNSTLADKARSRGMVEGQSADQIQSYIDQNRLPDYQSSTNKKKNSPKTGS